MYEGKKVYGPYKRKDGRLVVILKTPGSHNDHQTISYPKYLVETYLNRELLPNETIDHIDGNFENNDLSNLRIVDRSLHVKSHVQRKVIQTKKCVVCGKEFKTNSKRVTCSKSCTGKYSHMNNKIISKSEYEIHRDLLNDIHSILN